MCEDWGLSIYKNKWTLLIECSAANVNLAAHQDSNGILNHYVVNWDGVTTDEL